MNARFTGLLLAGALSLAVPGAFAAQTIERSIDTTADGEVRVRNVAGQVTIRGWDEARVELRIELSSDQQRVDIDDTPGRIAIDVRETEDRGRTRGRAATVTLSIPHGSRVDVSAVSADIDVGGVDGELSLQSVSGDLRVEGFGGELRARSVSGDQRLNGRGERGRVQLASVSGDVHLRGARGDLELSLVSGDADLGDGEFERVRINAVSGDVRGRLRLTPDGRFDGETVSGGLHIEFTDRLDGRFELQSFSGSIDDCDGHAAERTGRYAPGRRLSFERGDGTAVVRARTMSGAISICDVR